MKEIENLMRNLGKWIKDLLKGNQPEPVPVRVPVRR
jgi:hypothetical protein